MSSAFASPSLPDPEPGAGPEPGSPRPRIRAVRPRVVFDPGLPPPARQLVRAREAHGAPARRGMEEGWVGALAGAVLGSLVIVCGCTVVAQSVFGHWFLDAAASLAALVCGCFVLSFTAGYVWDRRPRLGEGRRRRTLAAAEGHYVLPDRLRPEARPLVARAQAAADTVLRSRAHRHDLLDRQRDSVSLPQQVWTVAENLLRYSTLAERLPGDPPRGSRSAEVVARHRAMLATALRGVDQRVRRLERYAAKVVRLDALYAEMVALERLEADGEELRELLARVEADNLAAPELDRMAEEARATLDAYAAALVEARDAALGALPEPAEPAEPAEPSDPSER